MMMMMRSKIVSLFLACALTLSGAGALSFDGVNDWFECDAYSMDAALEEVGVMAYVSPDFDSSDTATRGIIGNWNPAGCLQGFRLFWDGPNQQFRFVHSRWTGLACPPNGPFPSFCNMFEPFSAGDLLGIYSLLREPIQLCQMVNFTTGLEDSANFFFQPVVVFNSPKPLRIGDDGAGNPWKGVIHQVLLLSGGAKNSHLSQLGAFRKLRNIPQFTGTQGLNSSGGIVTVIDGAWNMESETASLDQMLGPGLSCVAVGSPTPVGTQMQR